MTAGFAAASRACHPSPTRRQPAVAPPIGPEPDQSPRRNVSVQSRPCIAGSRSSISAASPASSPSKPQLAPHHRQPFGPVKPGNRLQPLVGQIDRPVLIRIEKRQQRLGQPRQVPRQDQRLVGIGIAPLPVDRGKHRARRIGFQKGAGAIVDGLARQRHVVGVHHAMDKADPHPLRDQPRLPRRHRIKQPQRPRHARDSAARWYSPSAPAPCRSRRAPKRTETCRPGYDWPPPAPAPHRATPPASRQTVSPVATTASDRVVGTPKRRHRLGNQIFPQHRPDRRLAIAAARKRRPARPFQLQIPAPPVRAQKLAQQMRPPVAKLRRKPAELMPGIGQRHRLGPRRHLGPGKPRRSLAVGQVQPKVPRQIAVERQKPRRRRNRRVWSANRSPAGRADRYCQS